MTCSFNALTQRDRLGQRTNRRVVRFRCHFEVNIVVVAGGENGLALEPAVLVNPVTFRQFLLVTNWRA